MNSNPSLGSRIGRTGEILRNATLSGLTDYEKRFSAASEWYDSLLKNIIVDQYDLTEAYQTAKGFFGKDKVNFVAIDGTEYSVQLFDMVVFYAGAFSCEGSVNLSPDGIKLTYQDRFMDQGKDVSTCVPIYINKIPEIDQVFNDKDSAGVNIMKPLTEETILDNTNIPNSLMTFSEFYLACLASATGNTDVILLDRSISNMYSSLIYDTSVRTSWENNCTLVDFEFGGVPLDINDLTICRHNIISTQLELPPARGDYLRYAILESLKNCHSADFQSICKMAQATDNDKKSKRIRAYLQKWKEEDVIEEVDNERFALKDRYRSSWARIKNIVITIGKQLFESNDPFNITKKTGKELLTTLDFAFLTLFSLYMLIENCWKEKILLIGITKDTAAHDFLNHVIPICLNNNIWISNKLTQDKLDNIPNTDRMFLQSISMSHHDEIHIPWAMVEYDACFVTAIPDFKDRTGYISGAIKNRITPSKLFLRSFVQLQKAQRDPMLRSNVLAMDRLVYPEYDLSGDSILDFKHEFSGEEPIKLILFKNKEIKNEIQNLTINILKSMSAPSIGEAFGHNKALYIADKVAKWHNEQFRKIVDSMGSLIVSDKGLRNYVFYMNSFREKRQGFESNRKI